MLISLSTAEIQSVSSKLLLTREDIVNANGALSCDSARSESVFVEAEIANEVVRVCQVTGRVSEQEQYRLEGA